MYELGTLLGTLVKSTITAVGWEEIVITYTDGRDDTYVAGTTTGDSHVDGTRTV